VKPLPVENSPSTLLSAVLADDDRLTAISLAESLERHGVKAVAVAHSAGDAVTEVLGKRPDVVITDLDFGPGPTGIDVAIQARRVLPRIGVVIVTAYQDPRLLASSLPDAPLGTVYLVKQQLSSPTQVADAAREAVARAATGVPSSRPMRRVNLSDSQAELLRLVASGLSNQAIADSLHVTTKSVEKALTRLADRLHIDRSAEANVRVALTNRYLEYVGHTRG
jgi:DNA-binding NarL/FixJ family response regulator